MRTSGLVAGICHWSPVTGHWSVRSAAADWSRFPLGTQFRIADPPEIYEIDDAGSALVGKNTLDIDKLTARSMHQWGVRELENEVIE